MPAELTLDGPVKNRISGLGRDRDRACTFVLVYYFIIIVTIRIIFTVSAIILKY